VNTLSLSLSLSQFTYLYSYSVGKDDLPFWSKKKTIQTYLEQVNRESKVLEYTLFQPGLFLDYLASPFKTTKYVTPLDTFFNFQERRAIVVEGHEESAVVALTAVKDIVDIVVRAVDDPREWPRDGGVRGNRVSVAEVIRIGERVRGMFCFALAFFLCGNAGLIDTKNTGAPFTVEKVRLEDLQAGKLVTSWSLDKRHPGFSENQAGELEAMLKMVLIATLLSAAKGAWDVSDAWNQRFPDHQFAGAEEFLGEVWKDKP